MPSAIIAEQDIPISGVIEKSLLQGRRANTFTHNFCKPESWYQDSQAVTGETLTDTGDHIHYTPATSRYWVDVTHGKLFSEVYLRDTYRPVIKVDGDVVDEVNPDNGEGDYTINYATGQVTFEEALTGSEVVTADYHYVRSSVFKFPATPSNVLKVGYVQVTFSDPISIASNTIFQLWANLGEGMIPVSEAEVYQSWMDFILDANDYVQEIIAPGQSGPAWRNGNYKTHKFVFDYRDIAVITMDPTLSMEIRVWVDGDVPHLGELAIATFYVRKEAS